MPHLFTGRSFLDIPHLPPILLFPHEDCKIAARRKHFFIPVAEFCHGAPNQKAFLHIPAKPRNIHRRGTRTHSFQVLHFLFLCSLSLCGLCQSFDTSRQNHFTALDDIWQKRCKSTSSNFIAKDADWNVLQHPHVLQLRRVPFRHHFMLFSPSSHRYIHFERQRTRKNEGLRKNYGATNFSRSKLISASFHSLTHTQSCRNTHLSRANKDNGDHFHIKNKIDSKQIT